MEPFDLVVVGGGVNGAGIARDAAGRGLKVLLCEKDDLAQGTSSRSGKLVHGGLRYLEYYEFRLVREALIEREVLLRAAPHIIWPMRFVLPHVPEHAAGLARPRSGCSSTTIWAAASCCRRPARSTCAASPKGRPLRPEYAQGVRVFRLLGRRCAPGGAERARRPRQGCRDPDPHGAGRRPARWRALAGRARGPPRRQPPAGAGRVPSSTPPAPGSSRCWAGRWASTAAGACGWSRAAIWSPASSGTGSQAYLLQNTDKRVIFVNPYEGDLALIGTTDIPVEGRPEDAASTPAETDYLLDVLARYFTDPPGPADIVHSFSGVRPLYDDSAENPSAVTRDYVFDVEPRRPSRTGAAALRLRRQDHDLPQARRARAGQAGALLPAARARPGPPAAPMPGGDICRTPTSKAGCASSRRPRPGCRRRWPGTMAGSTARRAMALLEGAGARPISASISARLLYEREARFLVRQEWARDRRGHPDAAHQARSAPDRDRSCRVRQLVGRAIAVTPDTVERLARQGLVLGWRHHSSSA